MRLFKRRCSDPSPQLVSLSPICQDTIHGVPPPPPPPSSTPREAAERLAGATMSASRRSRTVADRRGVNTPGASSLGAAAPSPKSARKGLSTWGKKVGRKWEQLKRSDSAELLAVTPGRRRHWSPNKSLSGRRRISRVESLRNLFARNASERPPSVPSSASTPEISSSCNQATPSRVDKETSTDLNTPTTTTTILPESRKEILDLYKLNSYLEQNPSKAEEILDFLSQSTFTFEGSEFDKETTLRSSVGMNLTSTPKSTTLDSTTKKIHFPHSYIRSRLTVLPEEQASVAGSFARVSKRRYNRGHRTSSSCDDLLEETMRDRGVNTCTPQAEILLRKLPTRNGAARSVSACGIPTPVTMEDLCLFLNLLKSDESGYDSDSTRTGSDSPRSSIKSGLTEQLLPQRRDSITIPEVIDDGEVEDGERTLVEDTCIASDDDTMTPEKPGVNATDEDKWTATLSRQRATRYGRRGDGLLARKHLSMSLQALDGPDRDVMKESLACNQCVTQTTGRVYGRHSTSTMNLTRSRDSPSATTPTRSTPPASSSSSSSSVTSPREQMFANKEFKVLRLTKDKTGELGIFIKKKNPNAKTTCYVISHIAPGGLMDRDGRFMIGDEIVNVDGRRLRGMTLSEARTALRNTPREVEIVVARDRVPPPAEDVEEDKTVPPPPASPAVAEEPCTPPPMPPVTGMRKFSARRSSVCGMDAAGAGGTLSRRPKSLAMALFNVTFEKGPGKKSLGFSVVGGRDSPKGSMGIFVKTVFQTGQAAEEGSLREGDEILSVNGQPLHGLAHSEAIALFKHVKTGTVLLQVGRRDHLSQRRNASKSKSCDDLDKFDG